MSYTNEQMREFKERFSRLNLERLEPIREFVAMHSLENAGDVEECDKVDIAINTARSYVDDLDLGNELLRSYILPGTSIVWLESRTYGGKQNQPATFVKFSGKNSCRIDINGKLKTVQLRNIRA